MKKYCLYRFFLYFEKILPIMRSLRIIFAKICPRPLYCVLCGYQQVEDDWYFTRLISSYLFGILLACVLWKLIMIHFNVMPEIEYSILALVLVFMGKLLTTNILQVTVKNISLKQGISFTFSTSMKCITLLVFVAFLGKSGRSYLRALSFAYVIAGPIENLSENGAEIVRVFTCSAKLTYNLTRTRFDLMTKPFQKTLASMRDDMQDVQRTFANIRAIVEPIRQEIEGVDIEGNDENNIGNAINDVMYRLERLEQSQAALVQKNYKQKFKQRCKRQLAKGVLRCRQAFLKAYERCKLKFPFIVRSLLCWPFRVDFVCKLNLLGDPEQVCDPSDAIPADFGENYVNLTKTEQQLYTNASNVHVKYSVNKIEAPSGLRNAEKTAEMVTAEFNTKKHVFDSVLSIIKNFLSLIFIRVIFASFKYHSKYKTDITFDNLYITEYFKHIDKRRKLNGKRGILPLRKYESNKFIDLAYPCRSTTEESKAILFHFLQFSLEILTASFFLLLDYIIVELLQIVRTRSRITYIQEGEHTLKFHIKGSGLMAHLMRSILHNFNMHEHISAILANDVCLPKPTSLPKKFYMNLLALYLIIIVLIYKSTLFLRLRRLICKYFYHSREKQRILYLYNKVLKQRRSRFEFILRNMETNIASRQLNNHLNCLLKLRLKYPKCFNWLKCCMLARRQCLICDSLEDDNFIICFNQLCGVAYCEECGTDMGDICLACNHRINTVEIFNFNTFFKQLK